MLMMRILSLMKNDDGKMNNDEQWWWAKWIWFSGIRASAKTPIVSPWTQEPNLSRLTPMTSGVKIMRIFFRVNAKWLNVERFIIQRAFGPHTMMHGNVSLVLMRRELNWWSDPQLIVIKITMDWVFRWGGGGRMVIKAITTPVVKREEGSQKGRGGRGPDCIRRSSGPVTSRG